MEQLQGTSPQHFEPTSQGCHILTLNSKGVPLGNSQKMTIPDYQLNISAGCSLSLLQVPLVHMNPFCSTFYVPLLPLRFLKVSKGSKGISQIHLNEHELPHGTWNSCKGHPLNILSPPARVAILWPWEAREGMRGSENPKSPWTYLMAAPHFVCWNQPTFFLYYCLR